MDGRNLFKYTVTAIAITKPLQRIKFQVRVPENVYAIDGIAATVSLHELSVKKGVDPGHCAGSLSLALPDKGDVVYNEEVRLGFPDFLDFFEKLTYSNTPEFAFWISGKRYTYFDTFYLVKDALLEGFYESYYRPLAIPEPGTVYYKLNLYIRYLTKNPEA